MGYEVSVQVTFDDGTPHQLADQVLLALTAANLKPIRIGAWRDDEVDDDDYDLEDVDLSRG